MSVYIGELRAFAFMNMCPPRGWMVCDGAELAITDHPALFALISTQFGGDGVSTFSLPDLRGRTPVGVGQGVDLQPVGLGEQRGQEAVTLSASQVPALSHTHSVSVSGSLKIASSTAAGQQSIPANAVLAKGGGQATIYAPSTVAADTNIGPAQNFTGSAAANTAQPASAPVPTLPPQLGVVWCIAVEGVFPSKA